MLEHFNCLKLDSDLNRLTVCYACAWIWIRGRISLYCAALTCACSAAGINAIADQAVAAIEIH
jgi:hypothetical protein